MGEIETAGPVLETTWGNNFRSIFLLSPLVCKAGEGGRSLQRRLEAAGAHLVRLLYGHPGRIKQFGVKPRPRSSEKEKRRPPGLGREPRP